MERGRIERCGYGFTEPEHLYSPVGEIGLCACRHFWRPKDHARDAYEKALAAQALATRCWRQVSYIALVAGVALGFAAGVLWSH